MGDRWRPAIAILQHQIDEKLAQLDPRSDAYTSLKQDQEKITNFLQEELEPAAHGAYIVSNSAKGVFQASGFAIPLPTEAHVGPTPHLLTLAGLVEDNPPYGVPWQINTRRS